LLEVALNKENLADGLNSGSYREKKDEALLGQAHLGHRRNETKARHKVGVRES